MTITRKQIFGELSEDLKIVAESFQTIEPMNPADFCGGMTTQEMMLATSEHSQWKETVSRTADRLEAAIKDFDKKEFLSLCGIDQ